MNIFRRLSLLMAAISLFGMTSCGQTQKETKTAMENSNDKKVLVVYFSATGTTRDVAETIADLTGGTLFEITPETPYTAADLDWRDNSSRSSREMNDRSCRPPLREAQIDMADYDTVFIGYPIWWDVAPTAVNTFIEANDLSGKELYPFATSGGSSVAGSVRAFREEYPALRWHDGRLLRRGDRKGTAEWIESL